MVSSGVWNIRRIGTGDSEHTDTLTLRVERFFYSAELSLADACSSLGLTVISAGMLAKENVSVVSQRLTSKTPACKNFWRLKQIMLLFSRYRC